jgi:hypothetical protein
VAQALLLVSRECSGCIDKEHFRAVKRIQTGTSPNFVELEGRKGRLSIQMLHRMLQSLRRPD